MRSSLLNLGLYLEKLYGLVSGTIHFLHRSWLERERTNIYITAELICKLLQYEVVKLFSRQSSSFEITSLIRYGSQC
jgi:hypothetical protein